MLPGPQLQRAADAELLRLRLRARGAAVRAVVYLAAALIALVGAFFLVLAAFLALADSHGPIAAALILGGAGLALALVTAVLARAFAGRRHQAAADLAALEARAALQAELTRARLLVGAVAPGAGRWFDRHKLGVLAVAIIAGVLSGRKPH